MTTVNPVAAPQVSTVFRGKNKLPKTLNDILAQNTKIIKELPPDPDFGYDRTNEWNGLCGSGKIQGGSLYTAYG